MMPDVKYLTIPKGKMYFNQKINNVFTGERDLGEIPSATIGVAMETLPYVSGRGGIGKIVKDVPISTDITLTYTLSEFSEANIAMFQLGESILVPASQGVVVDEAVMAYPETRSMLANRGLSPTFSLPYDTGTALFVVGETVTGAGGAVGTVVSVTGTATTGTLEIFVVTPGFIDNEALTGSIAGLATVNSATGEVPGTAAITSVNSMSGGGGTAYAEGTDYVVLPHMKDDVIGRVLFPEGTTIPAGSEVFISYTYNAPTYSKIRAMTQTEIVGRGRYVSDNPTGENREYVFHNMSLKPEGEFPLIAGDEWAAMTITSKILADEAGHPDSPFMDVNKI